VTWTTTTILYDSNNLVSQISERDRTVRLCGHAEEYLNISESAFDCNVSPRS
jgi:hypothetical protein